MRILLIAILTLIGIPIVAFSDNWPQWRGASGNGVSTESNLPTRWSKDDVAWKAPLKGLGVSSPIVWGDRVFVTSQLGQGELRPGSHPTLAQGPGSSAEKPLGKGAAAAAEKQVYFLVEAFSRKDGRQIWEYWGHGSSPALYRDLLILECDHIPASYLIALDKKTGKEKWKVDRGKGVRSYSTPAVVRGPRGDELIVNASERIDAYDPASGKLLWYTGEPNRFPIPVPSSENGVLYASRGYRSGPFMAIRLGGTGDISHTHVQWLIPTGAPYVSSLVLYQGLIYMANDAGVASCFDAKTGEKVWQARTEGVFSASPVAGDGKVYLISETGETIVIKAGREFHVLARNELDERLVASPAISGGQLFMRTDNYLFCIGKKTSGPARQ